MLKLSIPSRMLRKRWILWGNKTRYFQFLLGCFILRKIQREWWMDKLSIPSRMLLQNYGAKPYFQTVYFQFLLGCFANFALVMTEETIELSIPSRMLLQQWGWTGHKKNHALLSIPSRMLLHNLVYKISKELVNLSIPSRMLPKNYSKTKIANRSFQFLLGCFQPIHIYHPEPRPIFPFNSF